MKKRLPVLVGLLAAVIPAVWISATKVDQLPAFVEASTRGPAETIGMFLFQSHEAGLAIMYPLILLYCAVFGMSVGMLCRFILRRRTNDDA
jgi:hypothetical protein